MLCCYYTPRSMLTLYCDVVYVLQVEDLRREALQNQRELLQEKTKVKALSEGTRTIYSSQQPQSTDTH
jgi:hypothetical protein